MRKVYNGWQLKSLFEQFGMHHTIFTFSSMQYYGDSFLNFGVRNKVVDGIPCYELFRINPVKDGKQDSIYYCKTTLKRIYTILMEV